MSLHDYFQQWKLVTLMIGLALLAAGSLFFRFKGRDWDISICLVMDVMANLFALWFAGGSRFR